MSNCKDTIPWVLSILWFVPVKTSVTYPNIGPFQSGLLQKNIPDEAKVCLVPVGGKQAKNLRCISFNAVGFVISCVHDLKYTYIYVIT